MAAIYSNGGNRWNILGFNFTKRNALSSVYKISMEITPSTVISPQVYPYNISVRITLSMHNTKNPSVTATSIHLKGCNFDNLTLFKLMKIRKLRSQKFRSLINVRPLLQKS